MKKNDDKKTDFLFRNGIIVIFISRDSFILGNSKYIYIPGEILNIFLYIRVNSMEHFEKWNKHFF